VLGERSFHPISQSPHLLICWRRKALKVTRRNLLKMIMVAASGAALPDDLLRALPKEGEWIPYEEYWSTGICLQCPSGCGLRIRSVNHWPVKLEGIKDYPINKGRLCPKGQSGLQVLYDPDRIRHPLKRKGKRGEETGKRFPGGRHPDPRRQIKDPAAREKT